MVLLWIIILFFLGGLLAWWSERWGHAWPRWISLLVTGGHMVLLLVLWGQHVQQIELTHGGPWLVEYNLPWIPQLGIGITLAMDGLSLLLIVLSNLLAIMAVGCSWVAIKRHVGFFHFNLLAILAALAGIFLAADLFLFFVFWELLLIPLYFLIVIWGHEHRVAAAIKFFIYTQSSGLFMLLGILGLYFLHGRSTGVYTFDFRELIGTPMPESTAWWLMLGFFFAFAVKLPVVPLHNWLPDAHTEAPTAGSVDLAGLVLKVGAYGMIRFVVVLFPRAALAFAPVAMWLGVVGIIYGALVAFGQTHLKRLVAYTSISHMGFVLLGIFAFNELALQGAVMVMLSHAISTSALFILVGDLYERVHTRDIREMGGLWSAIPRMGGTGMVFALASLGLPGMGNFVGEFLVLLGAYKVNPAATAVATVGFIVSTVYSLWIIQKVFHGAQQREWNIPDITGREATIMAAMTAIILWMGLFPQRILSTASRALEDLRTNVESSRSVVAVDPVPESPNVASSAGTAAMKDER